MLKNSLQLLGSTLAAATLMVLLSLPMGPAPALGPFLNPNSGFWANTVRISSVPPSAITLPDSLLRDTVRVYFDRHRIPHIFAANDHDLYVAQGFVTARDRLWQMELQTYAAAGRLSEILGPRTLGYDRYQRRIGMGYAAEQALQAMMADSATAAAVRAYAAGVNAWIAQLSPARYPVEYKILGHRPERWTPLKSALLLKYMTYTLAGSNQDLRMSNTRAFFGEDFITGVLNVNSKLNDPVIPPGTAWNFDPLPVTRPDSGFTPDVVADVPTFQPRPYNGSNNWAVSGRKTASGYPILANDPHLGLSLPSIWYAVQLHGPAQNVMGVSLPGAPAVIIGFNEQAAWATTNVSADVWDWYEVAFRDSSLTEYRYDGQWRPTETRIEEIRVRGRETVVDTVTYTHHGPVTQSFGGEPMRSHIPRYHAMRWIAHEPSNELKYFLEINKAASYDDYRAALHHFESPAQNWVFANRHDIAITVAGRYPLKWPGQGRFIGDGSDPSYDWQDWIPFEQIPAVKNPDRGFVSSANQDPTAPSYPYYLDDDFAPYERGRRINDRLDSLQNITPGDMQQLQLDTYSYHAQTTLPLFLEHLHADTLGEEGRRALDLLRGWDRHNSRDSQAASVFHYWWDAFYEGLWNDEYQAAGVPMKWPERDQTVQLIRDRAIDQWVDDITTEGQEKLPDLINRTYAEALGQLRADHGPMGTAWKWGNVNETVIGHVGQIPGLGRRHIYTGGGAESVNASRGGHGPSWRMVVSLGPEVRAWGVYPGGQSGSPASPHYDDMIDDWAEGRLFPLWFMRSQPAASDSVDYSLTIN